MTKSLMIDAGHGGVDSGAGGFGFKEKDWTLKISMYQYKRLKQLGANVGMTRTSDVTLTSVERTKKIKNKYDYCMSNHFNAFNGIARGVETIHSIYSSDTIAKKLAQATVQTSRLPFRRVFSRAGTNGDYYFMHRLTGTTETLIIEYGFIDHKLDNQYYQHDEQFYEVAEAVVKVWCEILGVTYVVVENEITEKGTYTISTAMSGYLTAADAKAQKNQRTTVKPGQYYIFKEANGMLNVTTKPGLPGSWILPTTISSSPETFRIRIKSAELYYYNKADWNAKAGTVKKDTILTVVDTLTVNGSQMYRLKSGNYITTNEMYVEKL